MEFTHVKCLAEVKDNDTVYCVEGKDYEIRHYIDSETLLIDCERSSGSDSIIITLYDEDFQFIKLDDRYKEYTLFSVNGLMRTKEPMTALRFVEMMFDLGFDFEGGARPVISDDEEE